MTPPLEGALRIESRERRPARHRSRRHLRPGAETPVARGGCLGVQQQVERACVCGGDLRVDSGSRPSFMARPVPPARGACSCAARPQQTVLPLPRSAVGALGQAALSPRNLLAPSSRLPDCFPQTLVAEDTVTSCGLPGVLKAPSDHWPPQPRGVSVAEQAAVGTWPRLARVVVALGPELPLPGGSRSAAVQCLKDAVTPSQGTLQPSRAGLLCAARGEQRGQETRVVVGGQGPPGQRGPCMAPRPDRLATQGTWSICCPFSGHSEQTRLNQWLPAARPSPAHRSLG